MSRAVKIFGDAAQGSLFFEGSPHPPAPLGGVVLAAARVGSTDRIIITRSDQFQKNGVDPRVLFKRMRITRVRNKENQRLVTHLYELCDKDCPEEYRQVVLSSLVERYAKESRD